MKRMPGLALDTEGRVEAPGSIAEMSSGIVRHRFLQDKRLMSFLSDYKAFDDYPLLADVLKAIAAGKMVKDCAAKQLRKGDDEYLKFADSLKESLVK
jgi:hypothetical protein